MLFDRRFAKLPYLKPKSDEVAVPSFSTEQTIRQIAPKIGTTGFAMAKELQLPGNVDKDTWSTRSNPCPVDYPHRNPQLTRFRSPVTTLSLDRSDRVSRSSIMHGVHVSQLSPRGSRHVPFQL